MSKRNKKGKKQMFNSASERAGAYAIAGAAIAVPVPFIGPFLGGAIGGAVGYFDHKRRG